MTAKRAAAPLTAFEIRRLTFRSSATLAPLLEGLDYRELGGGEIQVTDASYPRAVARLKAAKFQVTTVHDRRNDLPYIYRDRVNTPFRRIRVDDEVERWYYLSPNARRWRRAPSDQNYLVVRDGWALCHFPAHARREFFYLEGGKTINGCSIRGNEAILKGYAGVTGTLPIPIWEDARFLYAVWPGYVIPKEHETFLAEALSPLEQPLETEDMGTVWMWRQADRPLIEDVLRALRLELRSWSVAKDWIGTIATILTRAYRPYLAAWEGLGTFPEIVRCRAWEEISDEPLRKLLERLGQAEAEGNPQAAIILAYIAEKLPTVVHWREFTEGKIRGYVLDSSKVTWLGQQTGQHYYRLVLLDLGCVTGWKSRALPQWSGYARPVAEISHWRVLPYLGRMRTAPDAEIVPRVETEEEKTYMFTG
jgi:hypothetical protein